jgi:hypothetical protein
MHACRTREIGATRESLCNSHHLEMLGEMRELGRGSSERITKVGEFRGARKAKVGMHSCNAPTKSSKAGNAEPPSRDSQIR